MGKAFVSQLGSPANDQVIVLPLLLKDKIAALVYADGGAEGLLDFAALEVLVLSTSAWLEVASLRKVSQRDSDGASSGSPKRLRQRQPLRRSTILSHRMRRNIQRLRQRFLSRCDG